MAFVKVLLIWGFWLPQKILTFLELANSKCQQSFFQMFGSHCSLVIQILKISQNLIFPENTFHNYDKFVFLVPLYEMLSAVVNKSNMMVT